MSLESHQGDSQHQHCQDGHMCAHFTCLSLIVVWVSNLAVLEVEVGKI